MHDYALYYPTIEFHDFEWLWNASLLWDRIYRIVPAGYEPDDCENVRILAQSGEIGHAIRPEEYAPLVAKEFVDRIEEGRWDAAAVERDIPDEYARLHKGKVDVALREMIIAKGAGAEHKDWLYVRTEFGALYMTYLANHIAAMNKLQLLSDSTPAWTGSTYFRFDGDVQDYPREEYVQQLAVLVLRDFLPENITSVRPESILRFREKYRDERQRFLGALRKSAADISECTGAAVVRDRIEDMKKEIEASLKDYRKRIRPGFCGKWKWRNLQVGNHKAREGHARRNTPCPRSTLPHLIPPSSLCESSCKTC
ncbi:MAG: hypothetical protein KAY32_16595 [Candidatus Eisenbacteria sp.]|nr:hypothetical protein [Candidatus Eisenbacteria bacterium]